MPGGTGLEFGVFHKFAPAMIGEKVVSQSTRGDLLAVDDPETDRGGLWWMRLLHRCGRHPIASRMYARYVRWSISTSAP